MFSIQFLGTGTSVGVPMIGCACSVCTSTDPHNKRMRSALYVKLGDRGIVIDTPPDFREQALRFEIPRVDAVLFTHLHADHVFGFDDIRRFNTIQGNAVIPAYADPETLAGLRRVFNYIGQKPKLGLFRPLIEFQEITEAFTLFGARITPLPVEHGNGATLGYRFDYNGASFAYIPDCHCIPEATYSLLYGVDTLILEALRYRPHPTHLSVDEACAIARRIAPRQTFFTHICHDIDHADLESRLPPGIRPAFDGLTLDLLNP